MHAIDWTTLNPLDWFLILVAVASTIFAFSKGIIKVLCSLGGLILGIILASWNYVTFAIYLHRWIVSFATAQVVAFVLILVGVMVLFTYVARALRKAVKAVGLGIFDRLLGGAFGLVRGVLMGVAAMWAVLAFVPDSSWVKNSQLAPYFLAASHAVSFMLPQHFQDQVAQGATHLLQKSPELLVPHTLHQSQQDAQQ